MNLKRGSVCWVDLDPTKGSEIKKTRPCVIISATPINAVRRTVVVVPLSTAARSRPPIAVEVNCMGKTVVAVCDQIRTIDRTRIAGEVGDLSRDDLVKIEDALRAVLCL